MKPAAIGYLRRDVSGISQGWHEMQIRSLARCLGYDLSKTIVFGPGTADPVTQLIVAARKTEAEAVFVPSLWHLGDHVPSALVDVADVITVIPRYTYSRRLSNPSRN